MTFSTRVSVACTLMAVIGCAPEGDARLGETVSFLAFGAKRASDGSVCTADKDNKVVEADCLTIGHTWGAAHAKPDSKKNADDKLVYTGVDVDDDKDLMDKEKAFAAAFATKAMVAQGAVYGAHGCPGSIQGLPDKAPGGKDTILHESFGGTAIPLLALSVCWAGNTGADADDGAYSETPPTYKNNIPAASFVSTYFGIGAGAIIACKNGTVAPKDDTFFCLQTKLKKKNCVKRIEGAATLIKGDGAERGKATTKETSDDTSGDFKFELQKTPARHFIARNLPNTRPRDKEEPWSLPSRCNCSGQINDMQANYPSFWIETWFGPPPVAPTVCPDTGGGGGSGSGSGAFAFSGSGSGFPGIDASLPDGGGGGSGSGSDGGLPDGGGGSGSGSDGGIPGGGSGSGSGGGTSSRWYILHGQFLTTQIVIEQPNGSRVAASNASASPDGTYAQFQFTPTQSGVHYVWVTDLDALRNDPHDPNFVRETFSEFVVSSPSPQPLP